MLDSSAIGRHHFDMREIEASVGRKEPIHAPPTAANLTFAAIALSVTIAAAHLLRGQLPEQSLMLLFLLAVLLVSTTQGFWTGLLEALAAFAAFNFFFVEPVYTLQVDSPEDALSLGVLLVAGAATGLLAGRMRDQAAAAQARTGMLERIAIFSEEVGRAGSAVEAKRLMLEHLSAIEGGEAVLLESRGGALEPAMSVPRGLTLTAAENEAAARAARRNTGEPRSRRLADGMRFDFVSLGPSGSVVGYRPDEARQDRTPLATHLRETLVRQGVLAIDRIELAERARQAADLAMRESLRSALLSSLSHDLRTPLATILGGVTSLRELGQAMPEAARAELLAAVEEETRRLSLYVGNLLDMTRLNSGVEIRVAAIDMRETVWSAVARARRAYPGRTIQVRTGLAPITARIDATLVEQAIFNLLDNALKFSAQHQPIAVETTAGSDMATVAVSDRGPGISARDMERIFEPFYRSDTSTAFGTGLGLTIAHAIAKLHQGSITVESPGPDGTGAVFRLILPASEDTPGHG